eukprot:SAG31_NODE_9634_length_1248_cov_2.924282_1_plen_222_part_00
MPFYDACGPLIGAVFDGRDGTLDGAAAGFDGLLDRCLDEEMLDVAMLLGRVRELRADGCSVNLTAAGMTAVDGHNGRGNYRRRSQQKFNAASCANSQRSFVSRVDDVDVACCPSGTTSEATCKPEIFCRRKFGLDMADLLPSTLVTSANLESQSSRKPFPNVIGRKFKPSREFLTKGVPAISSDHSEYCSDVHCWLCHTMLGSTNYKILEPRWNYKIYSRS